MVSSHDVYPDGPMTSEQEAVAASLSVEIVAKIDAVLLSHARRQRRKVAMLVALTMRDLEDYALGLPAVYYAGRVKALVARELLIAEGNLDYMRYSEVRLP